MAEHVFETVDSQTLHVGKIFAVRSDEVRMPDGAVARRDIVEHHGAVGIVALDEQRNVCLIRQYRHAVGRRLWELPAGLLDVPGEAPQRAAARELLEEAGLVAGKWRVLIDVVSSAGFTDECVRIFLATGLSRAERPAAHDEEADLTVTQVPLAAAVARVLSGDIVNSLAVAVILAAATVADPGTLRSADAPWPDRPTAFEQRRARG